MGERKAGGASGGRRCPRSRDIPTPSDGTDPSWEQLWALGLQDEAGARPVLPLAGFLAPARPCRAPHRRPRGLLGLGGLLQPAPRYLQAAGGPGGLQPASRGAQHGARGHGAPSGARAPAGGPGAGRGPAACPAQPRLPRPPRREAGGLFPGGSLRAGRICSGPCGEGTLRCAKAWPGQVPGRVGAAEQGSQECKAEKARVAASLRLPCWSRASRAWRQKGVGEGEA